MFLPTYLAVVLAAPSFHRVMASRHLRAAVDGVTAAATGAIAGAVVVLGRRAIVDATTVGIALATLVLLVRARRVPEPALIVAAGVVGVVLKG
jgi:chromate transporter